jgi:hypothetical protein
MSTGKYLSLEEARKAKKLGRFAKEHASTGDEARFNALLGAMASASEVGSEKPSPAQGRARKPSKDDPS